MLAHAGAVQPGGMKSFMMEILRKISLFRQFRNEKWSPTRAFLTMTLDGSLIFSFSSCSFPSEGKSAESRFRLRWKNFACPPAGADRLKIFAPHRKE